MRIISGSLGGIFLDTPTQMPFTRPTTQIAKQGLFNIITNYLNIDKLNVLDLFGGTGAISFEFYSRGAKYITTVEKDPTIFSYLQKNVAKHKITNMTLIHADVLQFLNCCTDSYDFIFAGPPYALVDIPKLPNIVFSKKIIKPNSIFILEHTIDYTFKQEPYFWFDRNYGSTIFSFFIDKK